MKHQEEFPMSDTNKPEAASMQEQFTNLLENFKIPGVDVRDILDSHKKNIDSLTEASRITAQGATAVFQRQQEILRNALEQAAAMARELAATGSPQEIAAAQQELFKKALETGLANARGLAEMVEKSNREAFEVIQRRMAEGLEEIRRSLPRSKGTPAT
jgi:phasin family protein